MWKGYLEKARQSGKLYWGILRKYIYKKTQKQQRQEQQSEGLSEGQKDEGVSAAVSEESEEPNQPLGEKKRGRKSSKSKNKQSSTEVLGSQGKFATYYNRSVKQDFSESQEQRKMDQEVLTTSQRAFLSYLLAVDSLEWEFVKWTSRKYFRLLLKIRGK